MNTETGEVKFFKDGLVPQGKEEWVTIGDIVEMKGKKGQWRVTGMKPNGRLFLKLVK